MTAMAPPLPTPRLYRLVDQQGSPHPVLDDLYDSLESAWGEAQRWWQEHGGAVPDRSGRGAAMAIGVEVSTASGDWRTLRPPGA